MRNQQYMFAFCGGCSEYIHVAAVFEFEAFAQFGYGEWEVACGDIRLLDACQRLAQFALVERCDALYAEGSAWEAFDGLLCEEEVAVAADGRHAVGCRKLVEAAGFHD